MPRANQNFFHEGNSNEPLADIAAIAFGKTMENKEKQVHKAQRNHTKADALKQKKKKAAPAKRKIKKSQGIRLPLVVYDLILFLFTAAFLLVVYPSQVATQGFGDLVRHLSLCGVCIFACRYLFLVYRQIWRYGGTSSYIRLMAADFCAGILYCILEAIIPMIRVPFACKLSMVVLNLVFTIGIRMVYQYLYQYSSKESRFGNLMRKLAFKLMGLNIEPVYRGAGVMDQRVKIAIVGAGRVGTMLAKELLTNPNASYIPCCFIDTDKAKIGRSVFGLNVLAEEEATPEVLAGFPIQEIVFALPQIAIERKKELHEHYRKTGCKLKVYDYPTMESADTSVRHMREFEIEELLFRKAMEFTDKATSDYYRGKTVLISGGGGSIGSELSRQIARMQPKKLIILDVYENGAYDIQQELRIKYGKEFDLQVEIVTVCDPQQLERVFAKYKPEVVLHAAAHKHVPLMEHNCCEAVRNNVFGTLNIVKAAEKHGTKKFIMISTDKAVNPTNVMGATKRMCEMIVQSRSGSETSFSATRFGNVLGSNGSVIPLFKRQIRNGGPVTLTDKRIIRYFMTIPEASQLVLTSGAMANNGELYVLDMGKPVKILELAENMIRLSGFEPYRDIDIIETGLRPGEKLYEELLIKTEELDKTQNRMIFIERDKGLPQDEIAEKLDILYRALETNDDNKVKEALMKVVPTFHTPEEVNKKASKADEMKMVAS